MEFSDVLLLVVAYLSYGVTVFIAAYAADSLWEFFKGMVDPGYRGD